MTLGLEVFVVEARHMFMRLKWRNISITQVTGTGQDDECNRLLTPTTMNTSVILCSARDGVVWEVHVGQNSGFRFLDQTGVTHCQKGSAPNLRSCELGCCLERDGHVPILATIAQNAGHGMGDWLAGLSI